MVANLWCKKGNVNGCFKNSTTFYAAVVSKLSKGERKGSSVVSKFLLHFENGSQYGHVDNADLKPFKRFAFYACKINLSIYQSIFRVGQLEEKVAEFCENTDASTLILPNGETPDSVAALMQCYNQPVSFYISSQGQREKNLTRFLLGTHRSFESIPELHTNLSNFVPRTF